MWLTPQKRWLKDRDMDICNGIRTLYPKNPPNEPFDCQCQIFTLLRFVPEPPISVYIDRDLLTPVTPRQPTRLITTTRSCPEPLILFYIDRDLFTPVTPRQPTRLRTTTRSCPEHAILFYIDRDLFTPVTPKQPT